MKIALDLWQPQIYNIIDKENNNNYDKENIRKIVKLSERKNV